MNKRLLTGLVFGTFLATAQMPAQADEFNITNFGGRVPDKAELMNALLPSQDEVRASKFKARGIGPKKPKARGVSMGIRFAYNSYELTNEARQALDMVGEVISSERAEEFVFRIEGHTDASGTEDYNMSLSRQRADSVKNYLVSLFDVEPERLQTVGKGELELLDQGQPKSGTNRRVQILNLGTK